MQPERPLLPELEPLRPHAKARPVRRPRHAAPPAYLSRNSAKRASSSARLGERARLVRGPGADLAVARPAGEIGVGLRRGGRRDRALDADLAAQRLPVKAQRRARVGGQLLGLAAFEVGVEDEAVRDRRPSAAPRAPTARRRGSRWRASSSRPASRFSSASANQRANGANGSSSAISSVISLPPNRLRRGYGATAASPTPTPPRSATAAGAACRPTGGAGLRTSASSVGQRHPHRRRLRPDDPLHRRRHLHLPRRQRLRQPGAGERQAQRQIKIVQGRGLRGPTPAPRRRPGSAAVKPARASVCRCSSMTEVGTPEIGASIGDAAGHAAALRRDHSAAISARLKPSRTPPLLQMREPLVDPPGRQVGGDDRAEQHGIPRHVHPQQEDRDRGERAVHGLIRRQRADIDRRSRSSGSRSTPPRPPRRASPSRQRTAQFGMMQ